MGLGICTRLTRRECNKRSELVLLRYPLESEPSQHTLTHFRITAHRTSRSWVSFFRVALALLATDSYSAVPSLGLPCQCWAGLVVVDPCSASRSPPFMWHASVVLDILHRSLGSGCEPSGRQPSTVLTSGRVNHNSPVRIIT